MADYSGNEKYATPEQLAYARILNLGWKAGFLLTVATFLVYAFQILPPHIPLDQLSQYWSLSAKDYMARANLHGGWSWTHLLNKGDFLNFLGISFLASVTIFCYLRVLPFFLRNKDTVYAIICIVEVAILCLAASGILTAGH